jgi:ribosomal-protein-alanine N-acetyltransferase
LGDLLAAGLVLEDTVDDDAVPAIITAETCDLGYVFGIFRESQLIGEVSLSGVVRGNRQTAFLSLWVDADVRGEGVAEEAYVLLVGHAFDNLDLHRVEVAALPDNDAVIRALEKVGVESRGTDPRSVRIGGEWRDHERYVFTAEDWTKRGDELRSQFT